MEYKKITTIFIINIVLQCVNIIEEFFGNFWLITKVYGEPAFLLVNGVFLAIGIFLLLSMKKEKAWSLRMSVYYVSVLMINGIVHNLVTLSTGYFSGSYPTGFSGLLFVVTAPILIYYVYVSLYSVKKKKTPKGVFDCKVFGHLNIVFKLETLN